MTKPTRSALAMGAFVLFFMSFLMSGTTNPLPQVFFQRHYPEQKTFLLSVALLSSTVAAVAGVLISRRTRARRVAATVCIGTTAALAVAMLSANSATLFIACLVFVQFADNFIVNQIDHAAAARSGGLRSFNDGAGNAARLFGMLSAPAFFTVFSSLAMLERIVVAILGVAAMAGCLQLFLLQPEAQSTAAASTEDSEPDRADWLVFGFAIALYASLYLLAANLIYLFHDVFHIPGAETRGGIAVVVVFLAALLANGAVMAFRRSTAGLDGRDLRTAALALPALALMILAGIVLAGFQASYTICLTACVTVGALYGVFLQEIRAYSSSAATRGKTALLTWFNNMANVSSLFAFGLMLAMASRRSDDTRVYYTWLMSAIGALPAVGLVLLFSAAVLVRRTNARAGSDFRKDGQPAGW
jgi:MFS family permease